MKYVKNFCSGVIIGTANIIPGVSGGTLAVVLGIYDKLINAISLNFKKLKNNFWFLFTVLLGMAVGITVIAKVLDVLFEKYNVATQFFFIGLILGTTPLIISKITEKNKFKTINIIPFLVTFGLMILLATLKSGENVVREDVDFKYALVLIGCGAIAAIAMVVPGVSGSVIMTALGQYETIIKAVKFDNLNFAVIIPTAIGVIIGIFLAAKIISILLEKYYQGVYAAILGLVLGSVIQIYPTEFAFNAQGYVAILVLIIGFIIPLLMNTIGNKNANLD